MSNIPFKLFKYPSRNRPERFFAGLDNITNNISDKDYYHISCTLDLDDLTMNNTAIKERLATYPNISIEWGSSKSKIDAINRNMPDIDWDILIVMSDDMMYNVFGFDVMIGVDMLTWFPDYDGLGHWPDQDAKENLATMYVAGRKFYDRFGYIYHPSYKSLWADNEVMDVAQKLGKYKYMGYQINVHLNPAYGHLPKDEMFIEQQGYWGYDEMNYHKRKAMNFDLNINQNIQP